MARRAIRRALPEGWRVVRDDDRAEDTFLSAEVRFEVWPPGAVRECTAVRVVDDRHRGVWTVRPGSQSSWYREDEARARAVALRAAADECERRNDDGRK